MRTIRQFNGEYGFLSNFWPSEVLSPTLEHHYQMAKCDFWKEKIAEAKTAGKAKAMGKHFPQGDWDDAREQVMLNLVRLKFSDNTLKKLLLLTDNAILIEGNFWHDNFWGACLCVSCKGTIGYQNKLGKILMLVRSELKDT